ncbi:hypothetical protein [Schlesneria paludicola]|uniref:hypothetical protein n=1 Tax=Schlesneria paludicola TaxID=360056 RepID=UPI00029AF6F9|nr:hypothetical protein [Schlesneria paludicola]
MKSGPKPQPTAVASLAAVQPPPPDLLEIVPDPPDWCRDSSVELWQETCQILIDRNQLSRGDLKAVEAFVLSWNMIDMARDEGCVRDCDKLMLSATRFARELGLTPNARERFRIVAGSDEDPERTDELEQFKRG